MGSRTSMMRRSSLRSSTCWSVAAHGGHCRRVRGVGVDRASPVQNYLLGLLAKEPEDRPAAEEVADWFGRGAWRGTPEPLPSEQRHQLAHRPPRRRFHRPLGQCLRLGGEHPVADDRASGRHPPPAPGVPTPFPAGGRAGPACSSWRYWQACCGSPPARRERRRAHRPRAQAPPRPPYPQPRRSCRRRTSEPHHLHSTRERSLRRPASTAGAGMARTSAHRNSWSGRSDDRRALHGFLAGGDVWAISISALLRPTAVRH